MVKVSGKTLAAGKMEANVSGAIPADTTLPLTIVVSSPSQSQASLAYSAVVSFSLTPVWGNATSNVWPSTSTL